MAILIRSPLPRNGTDFRRKATPTSSKAAILMILFQRCRQMMNPDRSSVDHPDTINSRARTASINLSQIPAFIQRRKRL
jgi:hypothetical protein